MLPQQLHATLNYVLDFEKMRVRARDHDIKEDLGGAGEEGVAKGLMIRVEGARRRCGGVRSSSGFGFGAETTAAGPVIAVWWYKWWLSAIALSLYGPVNVVVVFR